MQQAKLLYQVKNEQEAIARFKNGKGAGKERFSPMQYLQADIQDLFSMFGLPPPQRRRLRTTKLIEQLFVEVR